MEEEQIRKTMKCSKAQWDTTFIAGLHRTWSGVAAAAAAESEDGIAFIAEAAEAAGAAGAAKAAEAAENDDEV
jgi:hypothetical protein